jgi:polysaccharide export outer membrane protein
MTPMANSILSGVLLCAVSIPLEAVAQIAPGPAPAAAQVAAELPADFVIGPDDVLGVVFWKEPDLTSDVTVRPDGRITLPVIGELAAAGLRPEQLQTEIVARASKYLTAPNVQVVVRTINSRRVFVTGRVTTPGGHLLNGPLTVMQAIALAGGLTEYADAKNIAVLRTTSKGTVRFQFNYKDVAKGKNLQQNIVLQPGDTLVVP